MKLILYKAIGEINSIVADEMKNLDVVEMKIMMQEGKIIIRTLWNDLSEFEMNELEIKNKCWDRNIKKWGKEDEKYIGLFKKI